MALLLLSACDDTDPPDGGTDAGRVDSGAQDAGPADSGADDAGPMDAGPLDSGPTDSGPTDSGPTDSGPMDAGFDAGPLDAGPADAGLDAGPPAPRFEDCDSSRVCAPDFRCEGFVESIGLGKCVPTVAPPGEGTECSVLDGCGDGLLCAGYTRGFGLCLPEWMRESFYDSEGAPIPDNASAGLTRTLTVYGLATVDMDVEMDLVFEHPAPSELRITLTNPDGNEVVVYNGATAGDPAGRVVIRAPLFGFSGDESVNGEWTLNVVDDVAGNTGTLERWTLTVASRYD